MMERESPRNQQTNQYSRRAFLQGLLAATGATALAACAPPVPRDSRPMVDDYATATRARVLASPEAQPGDGTPQPGLPGVTEGLEQFLLLSSVLTGVPNLDPVLGSVYLQAIQEGDFDAGLDQIYEMVSLNSEAEQDIGDLEQAGLFEQESTSTLADTIIRYWYTGVYDTPEGEQAVATYVDALAWKSLAWTKPNSICASPGFWEQRPRAANLDPNWAYQELGRDG